jgi:hypothetical protein
MAELSPVADRPAVGPVAAPRGEKPRRFIATSPDGLSGYWTSQTDAEIAAANAALNAERARIAAANLAFTPVAVAKAAAEREAAELRAFAEAWPQGPRAGLRLAHDNLRTAEEALAQHRRHAMAANDHVAQCRAAAARTATVVEAIRRAQSARLQDRLAGMAVAASIVANDEQDEAQAMADAEKARRAVIVAQSAAADLGAAVRTAEAAVTARRREVEAAARAVCVEAGRECARELVELERQVEAVRHRLWDFQAVTDYPAAAGRWAAHLRKLLDDPEASLLVAQAEEAG